MVPNNAPKPLVWLLAAAVACFISTACATEKGAEQKDSEAAQKSEKPAEPAEQEVKVYTNADLNKLSAQEESVERTALPPDDSSVEREPVMEIKVVEPEPGKQGSSDPLNLMQQQQAQTEERNRSRAEAELAVADARERIAQLEQRILALKNPFMARPVIPEDEKDAWDSMGTGDRLKKSEEELQQAREELKEAEKALAGVR